MRKWIPVIGRRWWLLCMLWGLLQTAIGQTVSATIYRDSAQVPLPYVSVGVKGTTTGTCSDARGYFTVKATAQDTLLFTCIGYKPLAVPVAALGTVVVLQEAVQPLSQVVVCSTDRFTYLKAGNLPAQTLVAFGGANQYAMLLQMPEKQEGVLEELFYTLQPDTRKNGRWQSLLRVRIYANQHGWPGQDLLSENLVVQVEPHIRKLRVNVAAYAVAVPAEGVFIGLDFLGYLDSDGYVLSYNKVNNRPQQLRVACSSGQPAALTYSRFFGTAWQLAGHHSRDGGWRAVSAKFGGRLAVRVP